MLPQFSTTSYDRMRVVTCVVVIIRDDKLYIYVFINMKLYWSQFFVCIGPVDIDFIWCLLGTRKSVCWWCGSVTLEWFRSLS